MYKKLLKEIVVKVSGVLRLIVIHVENRIRAKLTCFHFDTVQFVLLLFQWYMITMAKCNAHAYKIKTKWKLLKFNAFYLDSTMNCKEISVT